MKHYDAIVIGAGQAGTPLAKKLAQSGLKTALIEKRWLGGTCVNDGCSPTKTMIASAKAAWSAEHNKELGVTSEDISIDFKAIVKRKDELVERMRGNLEKGVAETEGLDLIEGEAKFTAEKEITVALKDGGNESLSATQFFLNVGLSPVIPDIEGIDSIDYLTSTSILDLQDIPNHLVILGSGYIGLEFGQMFRRFGSKVTILEPSERMMGKEDEDVVEEVMRILELEKIEVLTESKATAFEKDGASVNLTISTKEGPKTLDCSHVLVATGRKPNTKDLGLEAAGIKTDEHGHIVVDEYLQTSVKDIYAMGDVKGGPAFTHISYDDYRVILKNVVDKKPTKTTGRPVPYCMFIDPQLGRIGMTEQEAKEKGIEADIYLIKNESVARSIETGDTRGLMKAVVEKSSGKMLGAAILAEEGGEVVTVLEVAMMGGLTFDQIRDGIFAHPTYSESLNNLFMEPVK